MKASLYHVQLNVGNAGRSLPFYRGLVDYFGYRVMVETPSALGVTNGTTDVWLMEVPRDLRGTVFHRKNVGVNHLAFGVGRLEDVDALVAELMRPRRIAPLYDSPREYRSTERILRGVLRGSGSLEARGSVRARDHRPAPRAMRP